jgi:hypothetical protein
MSTINNYSTEIKSFKYSLPDYDFMHPSVIADGKRVYFASTKKGLFRGSRYFLCVNGWKATGAPQ